MLNKIVLTTLVINFFCFSPLSAKEKKYPLHWIDFGFLFPTDEPDYLPNLGDFSWYQKLHPSMFSELYQESLKFDPISENQLEAFPQEKFEIESKKCILDPYSWKLVAIRIDPFGNIGFGTPEAFGKLQETVKNHNHALVPQFRLTYQPFCNHHYSDRPKNWASDSAMHVVFTAYETEKQSRRHQKLWQRYRDSLESDALIKNRNRYLSFINYAKQKQSVRNWVEHILEFNRLRNTMNYSDQNIKFQEKCIQSERGFPCLKGNGELEKPIVHPGLRSQNQPIFQKIVNLLKKYSRPQNLWQIRTMNAGDGQLFWNFRNFEASFKFNKTRNTWQISKLTPQKISLWNSNSHGLPYKNLEIGLLDYMPIASLLSFESLPMLKKKNLFKNLNLSDVQASIQAAKKALAISEIEDDPTRLHSSQVNCHHCHASHERTTMAMRVAASEPAFEFGYLFRAFGYIGDLPFISRRFIKEGERTVEAIHGFLEEEKN